jgi:predicted nucleotidyltransferase
MSSTRFAELLALLARHGVEYIVVGGVAAVAHGAPITTQDLDIVQRRTPENVSRLLAALAEIDAVYANDQRRLRPDESHLLGPGHQLLDTRLGRLDVLGSLGPDVDFDKIAIDALEIDIAGVKTKIISLDQLISVKSQLARPKDQLMLLQLRALKTEKDRS